MNFDIFARKVFLATLFALIFSAALPGKSLAQPLTVTTLAGKFGVYGYTNGVGTNAVLGNPESISADGAGNLYMLDAYSVRKIATDGTVTTFAGQTNHGGYFDAPNANALFNFLQYENGGVSDNSDIALDSSGNIYIAETGNFDIRKISGGSVTTLAGNAYGHPGHADGTNSSAQFTEPHAITVDAQGNVYVADDDLYPAGPRIRKITPAGVVTTIAGDGTYGSLDGKGTNAQFEVAAGLAVDAGGTIYVADGFGVRKISPSGDVTTWVGDPNPYDFTESDGIGTNAGFAGNAEKIVLDGTGGAYVTDGDTIRYVSSLNTVTTVAGAAGQSATNSNNGVGSGALFGDAFGIAVDAARNVYISDAGDYTILKGAPPSLSPIGSFSESPGVTPVRSSNPWQFTAYDANIVSDLRLRVQSTTTTNLESSWTDLPGNPYMTDVGGNWTLNITDVPTGTRYFRVIASAPGYLDSVSAAAGPENVLDGIAPFGVFKWETTYPNEPGAPWAFNIDEASVIPGLSLRVQSNEDGKGWTDLPGGQMTRFGSTWALNTTNVPAGSVLFQVVASASNYVDRISAALGPFTIVEPLPPVTQSSSTSGNFKLESITGPTPEQVYFNAVSNAVVKFGCTDTVDYNSAVNLAGQQYAAAVLQIEQSQNVPILAVNMGQNATLILIGGITGDVSLIGQDGSGLASSTGGNLAHNSGTDALIGQDGSGLIGQDGSGLIGQDGSGLISQDGSGLISQDGSGLIGEDGSSVTTSVASKVKATPVLNAKKNGPIQPHDQTQPTFTGQMTINGNYSQFSGTTLMIGIAGTNTLSGGAQQFDQLVVSGQANLLGGTIAFELFDPNDQTDRTNFFQPAEGATFDVVVASNIVANAVHIRGPVWGDGLFFKGSIVTRDDGLQAVRLTATFIPPQIFLQNSGSALRLVYATNYTGYTIQSATSLSLSNWTAFSTGTNVIMLSKTNSSRFFRLSKP